MTDEPVTEILEAQAYHLPPSDAEPFALEPEELSIEEKLSKASLPSEAITGFVVFLTRDGHWVANSNVDMAQHVIKEREADFSDFVSGCQTVSTSAVTSMTVNAAATAIIQYLPKAVVQQQLMTAQEMAQQDQNRRIMEQANKTHPIPGMGKGMPSGLGGR